MGTDNVSTGRSACVHADPSNFIAYIYLIIIIMVGTMSDVRTTSDVPM